MRKHVQIRGDFEEDLEKTELTNEQIAVMAHIQIVFEDDDVKAVMTVKFVISTTQTTGSFLVPSRHGSPQLTRFVIHEILNRLQEIAHRFARRLDHEVHIMARMYNKGIMQDVERGIAPKCEREDLISPICDEQWFDFRIEVAQEGYHLLLAALELQPVLPFE